MAGKLLKDLQYSNVILAIPIVLALTACDDSGSFAFSASGDDEATQTAVPASPASEGERDVEAPDVFQVSELGLWDGRPSLGGVWVAHPDVTDPERVIIRNASNGTSVIGALFRRERENPGPSLQVSSDAAATLEMLAGAPAQLQVTALRREEAAPDTPMASADTGAFDAPTSDQPGAAVDIAVSPISSTPLDSPESGASVARDAAAAIAATPRATQSPSPLAAPFIQIGIFSIEDNAEGTATRLRSAGVTPQVLQQESQGRPFWRVIVGPAATESARAQDLQTVKSLGFDDAYFVTN